MGGDETTALHCRSAGDEWGGGGGDGIWCRLRGAERDPPVIRMVSCQFASMACQCQIDLKISEKLFRCIVYFTDVDIYT